MVVLATELALWPVKIGARLRSCCQVFTQMPSSRHEPVGVYPIPGTWIPDTTGGCSQDIIGWNATQYLNTGRKGDRQGLDPMFGPPQTLHLLSLKLVLRPPGFYKALMAVLCSSWRLWF